MLKRLTYKKTSNVRINNNVLILSNSAISNNGYGRIDNGGKNIYKDDSNIVSLSDRFGIRLGFFENNKENYLKIVQHYAEINGINLKKEQINKASEWSLEKGNFSGRTAYQFILNLKKLR